MTDVILGHSARSSKSIPEARLPIQPGLACDLAAAGRPGLATAGSPGFLGNTSLLSLPKAHRIEGLYRLADMAFRVFGPGRIDLPGGKSARFRSGMCRRVIITPDGLAKIRQAPGGGMFFGGLLVCGAVWLCPICEALIMGERRAELGALLAVHAQYGRKVSMLTLTAPHGPGDRLSVFWPLFNKAIERFCRHRQIAGALNRAGLIGRVGSVETTWGHSAGWHYHRHELLFLQNGIDPEVFKVLAAPIWAQICIAVGLGKPSFQHGLNVRTGDDVAGDYLTKVNSGLAHEFTSAASKTAKRGRFGIWDIVREFAENPEGFPQGAELFREFAGASYRKKRLIGLSKLQDFYDMELSKRDALCAVESETDSVLIALVGKIYFSLACRLGVRGELLRVARIAAEAGKDLESASADILAFILSLGGDV